MSTRWTVLIALVTGAHAPAQTDREVIAESAITVALGRQSQSLPANTTLVTRGSPMSFSLSLQGGSWWACPQSAATSVSPLLGQLPWSWPGEPRLSFRSGASASGWPTACPGLSASIGPNTVRTIFHVTNPTVGFLWIVGGTSGSGTAIAAVDADNDGVFETSGPSFDVVRTAVATPSTPLVVRVQTGLSIGSTLPDSGGAEVRVDYREGVPMARYGSICRRPGVSEQFETFAWANAGVLHFESKGIPITNISPFLVLGMRRTQVPLPISSCLLLTDLLIVEQLPSLTPIFSIGYAPALSGARFNAQWLVAAQPPTGPANWFTSNAIDVILP